jgi:hypothetical protein
MSKDEKLDTTDIVISEIKSICNKRYAFGNDNAKLITRDLSEYIEGKLNDKTDMVVSYVNSLLRLDKRPGLDTLEILSIRKIINSITY